MTFSPCKRYMSMMQIPRFERSYRYTSLSFLLIDLRLMNIRGLDPTTSAYPQE